MLKVIIDGPKGSGKSSAAKYLAEKLNARVEHFSNVRLLSQSQLINDNDCDENVIHDRGWLSYTIYGFLWDSWQKFDTEIVGTEIILKSWSNATFSNFSEMTSLADKVLILYSSNEDLLFERISKRKDEIGKGMSKSEESCLKHSNIMFQYWGLMLKALFPSQDIQVIDVSQFDNFEAFYEYLDGLIDEN